MFGYVYKTTNLINGKQYIGKHKSLIFDRNYKGSGLRIMEAFHKYGKHNFAVTIIEWCQTEEELNNRERYWISYYDAVCSNDFYNISNGGEGFGGLSGERSPTKRLDVRLKMKLNHADVSGSKNPNYGKKMSQHQRDKISETKRKNGDSVGKNNPMYGKTHTDAVKAKLSQIQKDNPKAITIAGLQNPNTGKKHINNGIISKTCKKDELTEYLKNGWKLGRLSKILGSETIEP